MFDRYRSIIPDYEAFLAALGEPLPADVRLNALKGDPAAMARSLDAAGVAAEAAPWAPGHVRLGSGVRPGTSLEYLVGLLHTQGLASAVPPLVLGPRPGERILDLCAAPGSKTTQIAALTGNRALLIANERVPGRAGTLVSNCARLGAIAAVTASPGDSFPGGLTTFDRVLVDAPCTGEGTVRVSAETRSEDGEHWATGLDRDAMRRVQTRLLTRAVRLVRPGGVVVYSTCSYAPEEDEAVVAAVLRSHPDIDIQDVPAAIPHAPGLSEFGGEAFGPALGRAARFYPHGIGSYGFFVCRLVRRGEAANAGEPPPDARGAGPTLSGEMDAVEAGLRYLDERFGVTAADLAGYGLHGARRALWLLPRALDPALLAALPGTTVPGLRLLRLTPSEATTRGQVAVKPTGSALQLLSASVRRSSIDLPADAAWAWAHGETLALLPGRETAATPGFVLLRAGGPSTPIGTGFPLGCGLLGKDGLRSQAPAEVRSRLRGSLFVAPRRQM